MMKITVIALAGLKEKYLREASDEFIKRLKGYCDLKIIEIEPVKLPEKPSEAEISAALDREYELIVKKIPQNSTVYTMCLEGTQLSSEEFAAALKADSDFGKAVTFVIGSSYGLSDKIKRRADKKLSFSRLTFPHQLFRILLLEQLYRAFRINSGGAYHK